MKKLIIMIPALNEAEQLPKLLEKIPASIENIDQIETLVIDDGSSDATLIIAKNKANFVISHQGNLGLGATFRSGLEFAIKSHADYLVNIDGDGQFNPADIEKLVRPLINNQADFVLGSRFINNQKSPLLMPTAKILGNKLLAGIISRFVGKKIYDVSCGFRAYNAKAFLNLNTFDGFTYTQESILDLNNKKIRFIEIPIDVKYFKERKSRVAKNLFRYGYRASNLVLKMFIDHKPFKFFGTIGLFIFSLGLIFDGYIIYYFLNYGSFTPYKYVGLLGGFLNLVGFFIIILGLLSDMIKRIRINQEQLLYYEKRKIYTKSKF